MVSLEARRNPVNQAAAACFLIAALSVATVLVKLAGSAVVTHAATNIVLFTVYSLLGLLVLRGSRAALIVGATLVALGCVGAFAAGALARGSVPAIAFFVAWYGALLFIMVRGIVVLSRHR